MQTLQAELEHQDESWHIPCAQTDSNMPRRDKVAFSAVP